MTFHKTLNGGTIDTITLFFERIGNTVSVYLPPIDLRIGVLPQTYIEAVGAMPSWAFAAQSVNPIVVKHAGQFYLGRIRFADNTIRIYRDIDGDVLWPITTNLNDSVGIPSYTTLSYSAKLLKLPPVYNATAETGVDPGDINPVYEQWSA